MGKLITEAVVARFGPRHASILHRKKRPVSTSFRPNRVKGAA
jgi:hypothetical protein